MEKNLANTHILLLFTEDAKFHTTCKQCKLFMEPIAVEGILTGCNVENWIKQNQGPFLLANTLIFLWLPIWTIFWDKSFEENNIEILEVQKNKEAWMQNNSFCFESFQFPGRTVQMATGILLKSEKYKISKKENKVMGKTGFFSVFLWWTWDHFSCKICIVWTQLKIFLMQQNLQVPALCELHPVWAGLIIKSTVDFFIFCTKL